MHRATNPALLADLSPAGHADMRQAVRGAGHVILRRLAALALCGLLLLAGPACMTASGNRTTGEWKTAALGTDASRYQVGPDGVEVTGMNQSVALGKTADVIKGMWSNTLTGMVAKYTFGKYYDNKGAELSAAKTVDLEKLRNAKSVADAGAAQKALETKLAAEAAAEAAKPVAAVITP